jgi:hypothetical protein
MPYITEEQRKQLKYLNYPTDAGEINYLISHIADGYLKAFGVNYRNINTLIGALECAQLELYRRIAAPYEDKKKEENGDVYSVKG